MPHERNYIDQLPYQTDKNIPISVISPSLPLPLADPEYNGVGDGLLTGDSDGDCDRPDKRFITSSKLTVL